jgi:hypothetical protein
MRKVLIACATLGALLFLVPLDSLARESGGQGGGRGGGWHGGGGMRGASVGRGGFRHGGFRASGFRQFRATRVHGGHLRRAHFRGAHFRHAELRGFRGHGRFVHRAAFTATPLLYAPYGYDFADYGFSYDYAYYDSCYESQPFPTPRGLIWRRVWVCY